MGGSSFWSSSVVPLESLSAVGSPGRPCRAEMAGGDHLVPYVNTWLWPSFTLVGASSLMFGVYIGKITNSHEWKEIFLDYCHHKRTTHSPNPLDKVARTVLNLLKISPK